MEKQLLIIRHAHRDTSDPYADNGLTEKGWQQARALANDYREVYLSRGRPQLLSSPRLRCIETLEPIGALLQQDIVVDPLLDEARDQEAAAIKRAEAFCERWKRAPSHWTVVSSHGDWIPWVTQILLGEALDLAKGGLCEIGEKKGEACQLVRVIQTFPLR